MAHGVIDFLEAVQVNAQQRETGATFCTPPSRFLKHLGEAGAVERAAQRIVVGHVPHAGLCTALLVHALPELIARKRHHHQQHQQNGPQNPPYRAPDAVGEIGLVHIGLHHAQHLAALHDRHIGFAVDGRAARLGLPDHVVVHLSGQHLVADGQLGDILGRMPDAVGVAGRRQRGRLCQIVRQQHPAPRSIKQLEAEHVAAAAQPLQLFPRCRREAAARQGQWQVRHRQAGKLGPANAGLLRIPSQLAFRFGADHPAEKNPGQHESRNP